MPTAFSYVRFSSDQQRHGASLERQRDMVAAWLRENPDHTLSDLRFEDLGVSGFKGDHLENAFGRLLAAVKSGEIKPGDSILIEAIDRAGRLPPDTMLNLLTVTTCKRKRPDLQSRPFSTGINCDCPARQTSISCE